GSRSYGYDESGLRTSITAGGVTRRTTWDKSVGIPVMTTDHDAAYIYGPTGMPLQRTASDGTTVYYHQDRLGSTRGVTDAAGASLGTYTYDVYGARTAATGTFDPVLGYNGQQTDPDTGYIYLRAR